MKNAYVLSHHHGDNGTVTEGMILKNVTDQRFKTLEKQGLVREATADEVKKGHEAPFTPSGEKIAGEGEKEAEAPSNKKAPEPKNKKGD